MPISSAQIAQMNSAYMQQHMGAMQYSGMISSGFPSTTFDQGEAAEQYAASGMNKMASVGAPLAMGGLALAGMDPIGLGVRAGMGAYGAGMGLGGAAAVGLGVAAPLMAGAAVAGYAGNQMMVGAQQEQGFRRGMRSSYNFWNPGNIAGGGRGFASQDIRQISGELRQMSEASYGVEGVVGMGGAGQGVSFQELGRLAQRMGQLGMAQGVTNAKQFTQRFREMIKQVKSIAEDMGTSLEEAQTMMASMRQSGVFRDQTAVAGQIRGAAIGGGLATTEVTGMMRVGSQISRMFGGRGQQGAVGGMETIAQIGAAQQIGALNEEDIYNMTGLTGAEGRRAASQQMMMQTGRFLRSGKGRYFLASVAGRNGELDPASVAAWEAGGMSVGDTRQQANRNLRGVGRADFIRNEGRLRGAVMEQFGGLAPAMAMTQWAESRGLDINTMNDREMLFMQRQLGMGRDEADVAVRMARNLPEIMRERKTRQRDDMFISRERARRMEQGFEGVKRRLENSRDRLNSELQKAGTKIFDGLTEMIGEWGNEVTGQIEERSMPQIRGLWRAAGAGSQTALRRLGIRGPGAASEMADLGLGAARGRIGGQASLVGGGVGMMAGEYTTGGGGYGADMFRFQAGLAELGGGPSRDKLLSDSMRSFISQHKDELQEIYTHGPTLSGKDAKERAAALRAFVASKGTGNDYALADEFEEAMASGAGFTAIEQEIGIEPESRVSATFGGGAVGRGRTRARDISLFELARRSRAGEFGKRLNLGEAIQMRYGPRTEQQRMSMRGQRLLGVGVGQVGGLDWGQRIGAGAGMMGGAMALGGALLTGGAVLPAAQVASRMFGERGEGFTEAATNVLSDWTFGAAVKGERLGARVSGRAAMGEAAAMFFEQEGGAQMALDIFGGSAADLNNVQKRVDREIRTLETRKRNNEELSDADQSRLGSYRKLALAAEYRKLYNQRGGKLTDRDWDKLIQRSKEQQEAAGGRPEDVTLESVQNEVAQMQEAASQEQLAVLRKTAKQVGESSHETRKELMASGLAVMDEEGVLVMSDQVRQQLTDMDAGADVFAAAELAIQAEHMGTRLGQVAKGASAGFIRSGLGDIAERRQQMWEKFEHMSADDLRKFATGFAGSDIAPAGYLLQRRRRAESRWKKLRRKTVTTGEGRGRKRRRATKGERGVAFVAGELGLDLSDEELMSFAGKQTTVGARMDAEEEGGVPGMEGIGEGGGRHSMIGLGQGQVGEAQRGRVTMDYMAAAGGIMAEAGLKENSEIQAKIAEAIEMSRSGVKGAAGKASTMLARAEEQIKGTDPEGAEKLRRMREGETPQDKMADRIVEAVNSSNQLLEGLLQAQESGKAILAQIAAKTGQKSDGES